jgi:isopentenyl-diphosphate delta-isomerase type 1
MSDEILEIVNEQGDVTGTATREEIHKDNSLLHRVVHLLLFNNRGSLLLQKRSISKDIAPGKWDTSVGGHVDPGEDINTALKREMEEELSLTSCETDFLYSYIHRNSNESELVYSFRGVFEGKVDFNKEEISEVKFWELDEISGVIDSGIFSNNFIDEFQRYMSFVKNATR